jgi:hypothetical protein
MRHLEQLFRATLTVSLPAWGLLHRLSTFRRAGLNRQYLLGDWRGERTRLASKEVTFDFFNQQ